MFFSDFLKSIRSLFKLTLGSWPGLKASNIEFLSFEFALIPVLELTKISLMPGGRLKGMFGLFLRTFFIKFLKIGAATELPVSLNPSGLGLSKPTKIPTTKSLENPMNHASVFELVVPVLPAKFLLRDLITIPVPLSTAPFSIDAIWYAEPEEIICFLESIDATAFSALTTVSGYFNIANNLPISKADKSDPENKAIENL